MSTIKIDYAGGSALEPPRMYDEEGGEIRDFRLYRVTIDVSVAGPEARYVLAHNEVEAKRMARCAAGLPLTGDQRTTVERLPLVVNGWGDNTF